MAALFMTLSVALAILSGSNSSDLFESPAKPGQEAGLQVDKPEESSVEPKTSESKEETLGQEEQASGEKKVEASPASEPKENPQKQNE
jgi:hypothetical protein